MHIKIHIHTAKSKKRDSHHRHRKSGVGSHYECDSAEDRPTGFPSFKIQVECGGGDYATHSTCILAGL
jgi:hypothetical protein